MKNKKKSKNKVKIHKTCLFLFDINKHLSKHYVKILSREYVDGQIILLE